MDENVNLLKKKQYVPPREPVINCRAQNPVPMSVRSTSHVEKDEIEMDSGAVTLECARMVVSIRQNALTKGVLLEDGPINVVTKSRPDGRVLLTASADGVLSDA